MRPLRVFGWQADPGTGYWRLRLPLGELARRGHDVMVDETMPNCVRYDGAADVIVASRTATLGPSTLFQRLAREGRSLMVYEIDDDPFSITPDNAKAYQFFQGPVLDNIRANLACADLVTVSTPTLAEAVSVYTSAPVVVLPNRVPRWLTELPMPLSTVSTAGALTVGHTGGASHVRDFGECAKPLRAFLQRQAGRAEFHAIGQDNTARVATIKGRTRHTGWTTDVAGYLRSIDFHIGLAPLRDTPFNRAKSALKLLEYGALGIPAIASNAGPYADVDSRGVLLASSPKQWREAFETLGGSADIRLSMGQLGRQWARGNLVEDHAGDWLAAYERAMSGRVAA